MTKSGVLVIAVLAALTFSLSSAAYADPPWARGDGHGKGHKHAKHDGKFKGFQPGPPPWAPAHGYRRKHGGGTYTFPTGLLGGRCRVDLLDGPTVGGLVGAAAGGLAGAQIGKGKGQLAATAIGTLVGFVIGQQVGQSLGRVEETCFSRTFEHVPDRETIVWNDAGHNAQYEVMPVRTAEAVNGMYCREYQAKASVGGKVSETYGTACRQPDGSWKLMN